jgi:pimeloyl-ACP methyl ester carboxylesterase
MRRSSNEERGLGRIAAAAIVAGTLLCLLAWPFAKAHLQAMAVLRKAGGEPVPWIARGVIVPVAIQDIEFSADAPAGPQLVRARLYLPQGRPNPPAMVIFHGVHHLGIDEPRLTAFATAMASCGMQVLTPELPGIKDYHVSEDSVRTIGESAKWYAARTGGPVGVMGLSFSGGLALVAAADPAYHANFKFVFAVGSQDSMLRVTQYYLSNQDVRPDGSLEVLTAHEYGPLVLEYEYLKDFVPAQDLEPVRAVLRAHLYEDKTAEAEARLGLNAAQQHEALALMDTSLPATRAGIAATIERHASDSPAVSPLGRLQTLHTPVYLLHGEADNIIPAAESLWLASELPQENLKAMLVSPVISHIDLNASPGTLDEWRLVHFFALIMRAAESK